jgi:hypothetical protein
MSLKIQWKCDTCGRKDIRTGSDLPAGWKVIGGRTITHCCTDCKPPEIDPGFVRKLRYWGARNPALALMIFNFAILSVFVCVGTAWCALQFQRLNARIAELQAANESLLDAIAKFSRR